MSTSTCLLGPFPKVPEVQEAVLIKKNEKKTLETFLAKSPLPLTLNLHTDSISKGSRSPRGRPYKKEREKNVRNVLSEISTFISSKLAYWVHFQRFRKSEAVPIKKKKKIKKSKLKKKIGNY